jgi:hypothetical protein
MPAYANSQPPLSLFPGDIGFSFSSEAVPSSATAGSQFALTAPAGFADTGRTVRWQTLFAVAPTAVNVSLQGAMADVDAEYKYLDSSTNVNGEGKTVASVQARFLRLRVNTSTVGSGSGFTGKILV